MPEYCGISKGLTHLSRRLVNISAVGLIRSERSRLPSITNTAPGNPPSLSVNIRDAQFGQKLRYSVFPESATYLKDPGLPLYSWKSVCGTAMKVALSPPEARLQSKQWQFATKVGSVSNPNLQAPQAHWAVYFFGITR